MTIKYATVAPLLLTGLLFSLVTSAPALALPQQATDPNTPVVTPAEEPSEADRAEYEDIGAAWYNRMVQALRQLNFDAALVHVQDDRIEPLRWLHGLDESQQEVELVMRLNGPDFRVLRFDDQTAYYQPASNSYSLRSNVVHGLVPAGFYEDFEQLSDYYRALPVGGARVADRDAQHIRVISRDNLRFGYSLWLDKETGMLLKSAMVTPQGDVVEQIQLTSLAIHQRFPANLEELRDVPRPPLLYDTDSLMKVRYKLLPGWLPDGFELRRSNHHRLAMTGIRADYFLFSDGLTEFSVYIAEADAAPTQPVAISGSDSLYSLQNSDFVVTVVGSLPITTAQRIAESIAVEPVVNSGAQP